MRHDTRPWATVTMADADEGGGSPSRARVTIYGPIGPTWDDSGTSPADLARRIEALDVDELDVFLSSPGGAAWDGLTIMNALRRHRARVTVTVDALAASAASVVAMAGDRVVMNRGAEMMVHDASGWCEGSAETMEETARILHKLSDSYAAAYAARAGGTPGEWRDRMRAETWFTAEEAVAAGLADEWVDAPDPAPQARTRWDLSSFRYQGRCAAPPPAAPAAGPGPTTIREETTVSDELAEGLRDRLGLTDPDAAPSTILEALDERLRAAAAPPGTALIDQAALADLREAAEAGRRALADLEGRRRDALVDDAVRQGRIAPAARASWREMADRDEEGTASLLASLVSGTVPVAEVGHGADDMTEEDRLYATAWGESTEETR